MADKNHTFLPSTDFPPDADEFTDPLCVVCGLKRRGHAGESKPTKTPKSH